MKLKTYKNGLRLIVDNSSASKSIACGIMVSVGSAYESAKTNGISHFIEHMAYKSTKNRTPEQIAREFDALGASSNAFTAKEYTCYYYKCIAEANERCFDILADIYLNPLYTQEDLDKERKVIIEEIGMSDDDADGLCYDSSMAALYGDSSLGRTILGSVENVSNFQKEDILAFRAEYYTPANTIVCFVGNISMEECEKILEKNMGDFLMCDSKRSELYTAPSVLEPTITVVERDFAQSTVTLTFPTVPFGADEIIPQSLADGIIGSYSSSRMFQRLREQHGLVYSVYSTTYLTRTMGIFAITLNVNPKNVRRALDEVVDELKLLITKGVNEDEAEVAKMQLKAAAVFSLENNRNVLFSALRYMALGNKFYNPDEIVAKLQKTSVDEINAYIKKYLSVKPVVSYAGKAIDKKELEFSI